MEKVALCKSKVLLVEKLTTSTTADNTLSPSIRRYGNSNFCLAFKGNC